MITRRLVLLRCGKGAGAIWVLGRAALAQDAPASSATFVLPQVDDDPVLRAMRDEMERSRQLKIASDQDAPYYFSYDLTDLVDLRAVASFGSLVESAQRHLLNPDADVRVGSYQLDNTGHIFSGQYSGSRYDGNWPEDSNYEALRDGFWLLTDRTFKTAMESMGRKRAALRNTAAVDQLPDFSKADPLVSLAKASHQKLDTSALTGRIVQASSVFSAFPDVLTSSVEVQVIDGISYFMSSEGTALRYPDRLSWILARAEGQAQDGMLLRDADPIPSLDIANLPQEADLRARVTQVAEHVRDLCKAPAGEAYLGPVLFEPEAGAQLMAQLVGDNLHVPRKPVSDPGRNVSIMSSEFENRVGSRVLPEWIDVTDDPLQTAWNGKPLAGHYQFDLEGMPAQKVAAIQKGVLKNFLMTRQPVKGFPASNGHARLAGSFGASTAGISNLFVTASESKPLADLKKQAIQMAMDRNKPYAMLVRKLSYPFTATVNDLRGLMQASQQSGGSARPFSPPALIYRIYPDGREELVRGLRFRGVSSRVLRDLSAATQETALFEFVNNSAPLALLGYGGYVAGAAVVAPGLLFEELELELPEEQLEKRPVVPPPGASSQ